MMGVAGGLAAAGFKPIAHTFGPLPPGAAMTRFLLAAGYAGK